MRVISAPWFARGLPQRRCVGERDKTFDRNILRARRRVDSGVFEQRNGIEPERLQARAQHLAALAEGRGGDALERARGRRAGVRARGASCTSDDVTFGGGTKAEGAMSNRIFASARQPASTESRPYVFDPGFATMRSATSRWNIRTSRSYQGGQGSAVSQPTSRAVAIL